MDEQEKRELVAPEQSAQVSALPPVLSVVIPTYNGKHLLEACLASIDRHRPARVTLEVIVVDDASTDGTVAWLESHFPGVRLVARAQNGGFCEAANAGIAAARGAFIQLLNNDAEVTAGWAEAGLAPFANPNVGSVAPLVLMRADPSRVDSAGDGYAFFGLPFKRGHGAHAARWQNQPAAEVFGASASSAFYRTEVLRRLGGFDAAFGSYYEDVDLAFRLRWAGYTCRFAPECVVLHDVSATYDHGSRELQRRMARNAELIFWRNLPMRWLIAAFLPHIAFLLVQSGWRTAQGRGWPFVLGKRDAACVMLRRGEHRPRSRMPRGPRKPRFPLSISPFVNGKPRASADEGAATCTRRPNKQNRCHRLPVESRVVQFHNAIHNRDRWLRGNDALAIPVQESWRLNRTFGDPRPRWDSKTFQPKPGWVDGLAQLYNLACENLLARHRPRISYRRATYLRKPGVRR